LEPKVIVIAGPTCSGKTSLSLKIAGKVNAEIISADSRQFYKYLNIGTAKPSVSELNEIPHHFIDFLLPDQIYNPIKFENEALNTILEILSRSKTPIVVGGS
jgi:tRNA dimethylallyltransferase